MTHYSLCTSRLTSKIDLTPWPKLRYFNLILLDQTNFEISTDIVLSNYNNDFKFTLIKESPTDLMNMLEMNSLLQIKRFEVHTTKLIMKMNKSNINMVEESNPTMF